MGKNLYNEIMVEKAIDVAPVGKRNRVPMAAIEQTVEQIVEKFHPHKVILFGSHAYGNPHPESDVDLLVVMETSRTGAQQAVEILQAVNSTFGLDLIVYTPQRITQRLNWGDSFLREVVTKGLIIYESTDQ